MKLTSSDVNRREIYRYLGYGRQTPDEAVLAMTQEVLQELLYVIEPRHLYQRYECHVSEDKIWVRTGAEDSGTLFTSKHLAKNLAGCEQVILMAATLGAEADKLLRRYEIMNMAKASAVQACGAACIEAYCNLLQEEIRKQMKKEGLYVKPRFSPGYGDLPLEAQRSFFARLSCTKFLGLTLTDSLLMYPTKSVTAFIGITKNPQGCHIAKCSSCKNTGCEFRYEI